MARTTQAALIVVVVVALLSFLSPKLAQAQTRLMCLTQIGLANQACSMLRFPGTPQPAGYMELTADNSGGNGTSSDGGGGGSGGGNGTSGGGNGTHHHHRHHQHHPQAEQDCCRWLKEVDDKCVCEVLLSLPRFLTKNNHSYSICVGSTCNVRFKCSGI